MTRPWLVVIDMQVVFADPDSPWGAPSFSSALPVVQELVEAHLPRVVFTRFVAPERPSGAWVSYYERWPFALVPEADPLYELVPELRRVVSELRRGVFELRRAGPPVVSRPTFGKWDEELAGIVGPDADLVLAGVSTDCCVLSTALAAADAGRRVRVVADACAGGSDLDHDRALHVMGLYAPLIEVTDAATVLRGG